MGEADGAGDTTGLEARLPETWHIETAGEEIRGRVAGGSETLARFSLRPDGDLWEANWETLPESSDRRCSSSAQVAGVKGRCIEWVVEKANGFAKTAGGRSS